MMKSLKKILLGASIIGAAAIPTKAESQVYMAGQTVDFTVVDPIREYALNPVEWNDIGFTITTNLGETYHGHLSPKDINSAGPQEPVVANDETSFGTLKNQYANKVKKALNKLITTPATAITLEIYNDANHDNQPDTWNGTGYLNYTNNYEIINGNNNLENIIMFEDRTNPNPKPFIGTYSFTNNGITDLQIEVLMSGKGVVAFQHPAQGLLSIPPNTTQQHYHNSQLDTAAEIARARQADDILNANTQGYDYSSLPAMITTTTYTGTSPRSGTDFDGSFEPLGGNISYFSISGRTYQINNTNSDSKQLAGLVLEKSGVYFLTGNKVFDSISGEVPDSAKDAMRLQQKLAEIQPNTLLDMKKYSITQ